MPEFLDNLTEGSLYVLDILAGGRPTGNGYCFARKELEEYYGALNPGESLDEALETLKNRGLGLTSPPGEVVLTAPAGLEECLREAGARQRADSFPSLTLEDLIKGFVAYCRKEAPHLPWEGGAGSWKTLSAGKEHHIRAKLTPFIGEPDPGSFQLVLGAWPRDLFPRWSGGFLEKPWVRQAAFYNLNVPSKMNIVPSDIFPYFDWFVREEFRVRIAPCSTFTRGLMEKGILRFEG